MLTSYEINMIARRVARMVVNELQEEKAMTPERYMDVKGAAAFLSMSPSTIYQKIKDIPHTKVDGKLLFTRESLHAWANGKK